MIAFLLPGPVLQTLLHQRRVRAGIPGRRKTGPLVAFEKAEIRFRLRGAVAARLSYTGRSRLTDRRPHRHTCRGRRLFPEQRMHYQLIYELVDDYLSRREPFRAEHLALAQAATARGELVLAGALSDPADQAVLVFEGDSPEAAESFARADPYVQNGLVKSWRVRPWRVVVGKHAPR